MNEEGEVEFIDAEKQYQIQKPTSFKEQVMTALNRIGVICTSEFRKGYWKDIRKQIGGSVLVTKEWVKDTGEEYINAVDYLHILLKPHIETLSDKAIEDKLKEISKDLSEKKEILTADDWYYYRLSSRKLILEQLSFVLFKKKYFESGGLRD